MYHLDSDHRHIFRHHPQKHFTIIVHFAVIYILYYEQKKHETSILDLLTFCPDSISGSSINITPQTILTHAQLQLLFPSLIY